MKAGHVAQLVGAVADNMAARDKASRCTHDTTAHALRLEALESLVDIVAEVMLAGTSADPAAQPATKTPTKAKTAKRVRK